MRKLWLVVLVMALCAMADRKTIIVGGAGTGADASDLNGGAYKGAVTWSTAQGANGGPIATASGASATDNGSSIVRVTSSGAFASVQDSTLAYCDFAATYTDGRYWVVDVDASGNWVDLGLAYSSDATVTTINVGGALANCQAPWALSIVDTMDIVKIAGGPYTTATGNYIIDASTAVAGSTAQDKMKNAVLILGVSRYGNFTYDTLIEVDASANSVVNCIGIQAYNRVVGFYCHGASGWGVTGASTNPGADNVVVDFCKITGCGANNTSSGGIGFDNYLMVNYCYSYSNNGVGLDADGAVHIYGSKFRNNKTYEINFNFGSVTRCEISNNERTTTLLRMDEQNPQCFAIYDCTFDGGDTTNTVGFKFGSIVQASAGVMINGNIFANCDTAIVSNIEMKNVSSTYANLFYNNTVDVSVNNYAEKGFYSRAGDPNFTNAATGDFSLGSGSAAADSAIDVTIW